MVAQGQITPPFDIKYVFTCYSDTIRQTCYLRLHCLLSILPIPFQEQKIMSKNRKNNKEGKKEPMMTQKEKKAAKKLKKDSKDSTSLSDL